MGSLGCNVCAAGEGRAERAQHSQVLRALPPHARDGWCCRFETAARLWPHDYDWSLSTLSVSDQNGETEMVGLRTRA